MPEGDITTGSQVTTGDPRPGRERWVYLRAGPPCRRCATPIRRRDATPGPDGERGTYRRPRCQAA